MDAVDYYQLCEDALLERLRSLKDFFPKEEFVTDDDAILNKGASYYAVLTPDAFPVTRVDARNSDFDWTILMDVYVKFVTQRESKHKIKTIRSALVNMLYPSSLNYVIGVSRVSIAANGGLFQDAPERPNFVWQTFLITVTQRVRFEING